MINKKLFLITLLVVLTLSLGVTSATDISDNNEPSDETTTIEQQPINNQNNEIQTTNTKNTPKEINKQTQNTTKKATNIIVNEYEELRDNLTNPEADSDLTITLGGDEEKYSISQPIQISNSIKNLVIEGNGKIMDGEESRFLVADNMNITLNNMTIKNFYSSNRRSSVLNLTHGNLTINNTYFTMNQGNGNTINLGEAEEVIIENSRFSSNYNRYEGLFKINNTGKITIDSSTFNNNFGNSGSVLTVNGKSGTEVEIKNSSFILNGNNAEDPLYTADDYSFLGPIDINNNDNNKFTVINSNFTANQAYFGSSIDYSGHHNNTINITNSIFKANGLLESYMYESRGGVLRIYYYDNSSTIISNSDFYDNKAIHEAVAYVYGERNNKILIENSNFRSNRAHFNTLYLEGTENSTLVFENSTMKMNGYYDNDEEGYGYYGFTEEGALSIFNFETIINNSIFTNNQAVTGSAVSFNDYIGVNLLINNSKFDGNTFKRTKENSGTNTIDIEAMGNVTIANSIFSNHTLTGENGLIKYDSSPYTDYTEKDNHMIIDNVNFTTNIGPDSTALHLENGNVSINNSNFIDNKAFYNMEVNTYEGPKLISSNALLTINNSNFIGNGLPDDVYYEANPYLATSGFVIDQGGADLTIDNSTFISNIGGGSDGSPIYYYGEKWDDIEQTDVYYTLKINNSLFKDNYATTFYSENIAPSIYIASGNAIIDNTYFISNIADATYARSDIPNDPIMNISVICAGWNEQNSCNVTNCVFIDNNPSNFIIKDNMVYMPQLEYYDEYIGAYFKYVLDDGYIPIPADVMVYIDESEEGTLHKLVYEQETIHTEYDDYMTIYDVRVDNLIIDDNSYVYKLVFDQTDESSYSDKNEYYNNTYYFKIPHDYILSLEADDIVKYGDNNKITGKLYFLNSEENEVGIKNKIIDLYINDTYINSTTTNADGIYEFNYTAETLGNQNVTVKFPGTLYLSELTNNTNFNVEIRNTIINITANDTVLGKTCNITTKLTDTDANPIANANITLYVNGKQYHNKTNDEGIVQIEYPTTISGENHIIAIYMGDYGYFESSNSTTFQTNRLNTTITVTATDTIINNKTIISGKLFDENNNPITVASITIYINDKPETTETDLNGEFSIEYTANISGENYVEVYYKGNITYLSNINSTIFLADKINTTTNPIIISEKVGNTSFNVKVEGDDKNIITSGTITITDNDGNIVATNTITGEETTVTITNITSGTYEFTIKYEGNDTYKMSNTTRTVTIKPETQINIEILNSTEGNVKLEITVADETGKPITGQEVNITLPDGTKITRTTDSNGKIIETDTTAITGEKTIKAEIEDNDNIIGTSETKTIIIGSDYNKIIEEINEKVDNLTKQLEEVNNTNKELTQELADSKQEIKDIEERIEDVQNENKKLNTQKNNLEDEIHDLEDKLQDLENKIDTLNKTSSIKAVSTNGTVDNNNIIVTIENKLGTPISNAPITAKNSKGETVGKGTTDEKGVVIIPIDTRAGTENITITYSGNNKFTPENITVPVTTSKNNVTVTVDSLKGIIGEDITFTAHITDTNGNKVSGGNLIFKLNGKTLKNDGRFGSNASAWKLEVKNGIVKVTIKADLYLRNAKNITASYSGTYKYEEAKSNTVTAEIKKRDAKISVTVSPKTQKQYNTITFKATLTDITSNTKNTTAINTDVKVLFKINGKTIKDTKGNAILVKVVNGVANYKYTVPQGMGGITKTGDTRDYIVEAILVSDTYYPDTRAETTFKVERSPTTIEINKVNINSKNILSIKANIKDYKGNNLIGENDVNIKINGKTYVNPTTNKTHNFKVTDGKINLNNLVLPKNINVKTVTVVTGARQAYLESRNETTNIVKA